MTVLTVFAAILQLPWATLTRAFRPLQGEGVSPWDWARLGLRPRQALPPIHPSPGPASLWAGSGLDGQWEGKVLQEGALT